MTTPTMPGWTLVHDALVVATLTPSPGDGGRWRQCVFEALDGFEAFAPLFDRDREILTAGSIDGDHDRHAHESNELWAQIWATGLQLRLDDGATPRTWLMHLDGSQARVRWIDPKFEVD